LDTSIQMLKVVKTMCSYAISNKATVSSQSESSWTNSSETESRPSQIPSPGRDTPNIGLETETGLQYRSLDRQYLWQMLILKY